ncbi:MAG: glycoside hydrolase 100 family protein [Gammaproteobacteria bacterium]
MEDPAIDSAYELLRDCEVRYRGKRVGTLAAKVHGHSTDNYHQCFVRDFVPAALVYLLDGDADIVRNFLDTVLEARRQEHELPEHDVQPGVMPASFRVSPGTDRQQTLKADFGDRAVGRVAPVDAMMWWAVVLHAYVQHTGDRDLARQPEYQQALEMMLSLCLKSAFEIFPTLLVPDGAFMIDRRMGVYGHPLEIQSLFYAMLEATVGLLEDGHAGALVIERADKRREILRGYVRRYYWLDQDRLSRIHRFSGNDFDDAKDNVFNVHPEILPLWLSDWLPDGAGFFVGNVGPQRIDFRLFSLGNLLAVIFGLASDTQSQQLMNLYEARWEALVGAAPLKICYPALTGDAWHTVTGADPKNRPWSYHNGGNWPVLLWALVAAALKCGRRELAERAMEAARGRVPQDGWPEYYDGRHGRLIGHESHFNQVWSASAYILSRRLLDDPGGLSMLPGC